MLPSDPEMIASLARVLHVTTDWLIGGPTAGGQAAELHDGSRGGYLDPAMEELPPGARQIAISYLDRMRASGCTKNQIKGAESLLLAAARNRISSTRMENRGEDELCAAIDGAWDLVVGILRREGIRP
jgi:hypothetical protein